MIGPGVAPALAQQLAAAKVVSVHEELSDDALLEAESIPVPSAPAKGLLQVAPPGFVSPVPARPAAAQPVRMVAALREEPRYLPGDPMAPQPSAATNPRVHSQRLRVSDSVYGAPKRDRPWLYWAVGAVVVLSLVVLAMGLF
jgi:hypothetical protein